MTGTGTYNSPLLNPITKPFDELTEKQQAFVLAFVRTGDMVESYVQAGYKGARKAMLPNARSLFLKLKKQIAQQVDARIGSQVPLALNCYEFILGPDSPASLNLKAKVAADVLTRAGHAQAQEIVLTDARTPEEMDTNSIKAELEALLKSKEIADMGLDLIERKH